MNKTEKIVTMIVALVGGAAGIWGAYTAHDSSKFKQPFDEREQIISSFNSQIASADKRKALQEVERVSLLLEQYEEGWRAARQLTKLVAPVESLSRINLDAQQSQSIRALLSTLSNSPAEVNISAKTLGAAYLATGNYADAIEQLNHVPIGGDNSNLDALKAAAYSGLASNTLDVKAQASYEANALEYFTSAQEASSGEDSKLTDFANKDLQLKAILEANGVNLAPSTNHYQ